MISITASGDPSGSCSTSRSASAGRTAAGTVSVTGIGQGVPSASSPLAATADRSSARQVPAQRGERARGEQLKLAELLLARGPGRPGGQLGGQLHVTCASVSRMWTTLARSDDAGETVHRLADHVQQLIVAVGEASSGQPGDGGADDSHRR